MIKGGIWNSRVRQAYILHPTPAVSPQISSIAQESVGTSTSVGYSFSGVPFRGSLFIEARDT